MVWNLDSFSVEVLRLALAIGVASCVSCIVWVCIKLQRVELTAVQIC